MLETLISNHTTKFTALAEKVFFVDPTFCRFTRLYPVNY
jgi:hypothetical protein